MNCSNKTDPTENFRKYMVKVINHSPSERQELEHQYGKVWDTTELTDEFEVQGFMAPFCIVKRRTDGVRGSVLFQHHPRYYHSFNKGAL